MRFGHVPVGETRSGRWRLGDLDRWWTIFAMDDGTTWFNLQVGNRLGMTSEDVYERDMWVGTEPEADHRLARTMAAYPKAAWFVVNVGDFERRMRSYFSTGYPGRRAKHAGSAAAFAALDAEWERDYPPPVNPEVKGWTWPCESCPKGQHRWPHVHGPQGPVEVARALTVDPPHGPWTCGCEVHALLAARGYLTVDEWPAVKPSYIEAHWTDAQKAFYEKTQVSKAALKAKADAIDWTAVKGKIAAIAADLSDAQKAFYESQAALHSEKA